MKRLGGPAAGLGIAMAGGQVLSLAFTIGLTHLLGPADYSSLAALTATWLVLAIPGTALQTAAAREIAGAEATDVPATVRRLEREAAALTVGLAAIGVVAREPIAAVIGVGDVPWAAAAVPAAAGLWLFLSIQRGVLQGGGDYRSVGWSVVLEATLRLALCVAAAAVDLGVTVVWLCLALSLPLTSFLVGGRVRRVQAGEAVHGTGHDLVWVARRAWAPIVALSLVAALQNVDVIVAKHVASEHAAGAYAAASLAAKAITWIAVGLGLYLLPETARRARAGQAVQGLLVESAGLLLLVAVPVVAVFAVFGDTLLETVFGRGYGDASPVLPLLGVAMGLLSLTYLSVQSMLGLGRAGFVLALACAAVAAPFVLGAQGSDLTALARALCGLQIALLAVVGGLALRASQDLRHEGIS